MKPSLKIALVAAGYVACLLLASAVVAVRIASTDGAASQAAGGMYAFGDTALFVGVFGVSALVPTGAALFFLRPYRLFWTVFSAAGLVIAATGVTAAILYAVGRHALNTPLGMLAGYSVLRILVSPLLALAFLVCAAFAPLRSPRIAFLTAAVMEVAVCAYIATVFLLGRR